MKANELMIGDWVRVLPISRKIEAHNSQWKDKNGVEDLKKARHYIDYLIKQQDEDRNY